jgi:hypothetical protein
MLQGVESMFEDHHATFNAGICIVGWDIGGFLGTASLRTQGAVDESRPISWFWLWSGLSQRDAARNIGILSMDAMGIEPDPCSFTGTSALEASALERRTVRQSMVLVAIDHQVSLAYAASFAKSVATSTCQEYSGSC